MRKAGSGDRPSHLLSAQELADYLDVPLKTIYAWRHRRIGPPGFRVGRHLRFRWSDVERWIGEQILDKSDAGSSGPVWSRRGHRP